MRVITIVFLLGEISQNFKLQKKKMGLQPVQRVFHEKIDSNSLNFEEKKIPKSSDFYAKFIY
jgi:hypothetical protein